MAHPDRRIDPGRCLARLRQLRAALGVEDGGRRVELYSRSARRLRVRMTATGRRVDRGVDEGLALRLGDRQGRDLGFAAASGVDPATVRGLLAAADRSSPSERGASLASPGSVDDLADVDVELPTVERLSDELHRLSRGRGEAWIEAAETVEALRTDEGPEVVRARLRFWAMVRLEGIPHLRAGRRFEELQVPDDFDPGRTDSPFWVLAPEAAATVARALMASDRPPAERRWRVVDDPSHPKAVAGGTFDDAGHPTRRRRLVPGAAPDPVAGRLQRPSFLDRPRPGWAVPVIEAGSAGPVPTESLAVGVVRIHPLTRERWLIELPEARRIVAACDPRRLDQGIVGGIGASRATPDGAVTPALLIDVRQAAG